MSSFKDTSNWTEKNETSLDYMYEVDGKQYEGTAEKRPNSILVQLDRFSVLSETSWQIKDEKEPEKEAGYFTREYISASGVMENCRIYAITLDDDPNETFSRMDVSIYPAELKSLVRTSTTDQFYYLLSEDDMPEEGWLNGEVGRIRCYSDGEYHREAQLFATLFLSQEKFDSLVKDIKAGHIRSVRLDVFADLFEFGFEGMVAGNPGHLYNYAILSKAEGDSAFGASKGSSGHTKARLQEICLEWSPSIDKRVVSRREEMGEDEYLEEGSETLDTDAKKVVARMSGDVQAIRGRIETFYQAAIFIVIILVISQVSSWLGLKL